MQSGVTLEARAEDQKRFAACAVALAAGGRSPASAWQLHRERGCRSRGTDAIQQRDRGGEGN